MHKNLPNLSLFTSGRILSAESDNIYSLVMDTFCLAANFFVVFVKKKMLFNLTAV